MSRLALLQFLVFLLFVSATPVNAPVSPGSLEGIDIVFDSEPRMFPNNWYCKRISAEAVSLPKAYRTQAMDILNSAIAKYPEEVLFVYLRKVYVLQSMTFFGVPYGGTNARDVIYLAYDDINPKRTADYVEGVFHHEFSSVLLRKFHKQFDKEGWLEVNPLEFRYGEGGVQAIKNGEASMEYDYNLHQVGFLNKYSQSAFEEDINVFAQNIFSGGEQFWYIVDSFATIRKKTELIIRFYHRIDPIFTEEYFRALACPR
ncbi:MAG: hypothetical protein V1733_05035 [bacterium]